MPPWTNQFSLSLELTRMFPLDLAASNTILSLARSLKNSGSDLVVEEDLATIFGRCRISPQMATSFRTVVARNESSILNSALGLILRGGPGPTVLRALNKAPYFAMVIQCSLLAFIHGKHQLAAALSNTIEREAENDDPHKTSRAAPDYEGIYGVLRACEDQTASYNWKGVIFAIARALDITEDDALSAIPSNVLQGAVHTFPLVQTLPDDRMILIDTSNHAGACSLAVWAHHVLGLTVLVKQYGPKNELIEKKFGVGTTQVVMDLRDRSMSSDMSTFEVKPPSITLFSVPDNEMLMTLRPEPDEVKIDAVFIQSAGRYGTKILESVCGVEEGKDALVHELTMLAVAFAAIISQHLSPKPRSAFADDASLPGRLEIHTSKNELTDDTPGDDTFHEDLKCTISEQDLMGAARFLFHNSMLNKKSIMAHILMFSDRPLNMKLEMPQSISMVLGQMRLEVSQETMWLEMLEKVRYLSVIILAFTYVKDLKNCAELPLSHSVNVLSRNNLIIEINHWDGKSRIWIPEDTWFLVFVQLLLGHRTAVDPKSTCLISERGWSIFLSTFGDSDPSFTNAGYVGIKKGVPCRNGVWKHAITDGPIDTWGEDWEIVHTAGTKESLRCANAVYTKQPLCGDRIGKFLITLRFTRESSSKTETTQTVYKGSTRMEEIENRKSGYRELFAALWGIQHTKSYQHESSEMTLPLSCASVSGFGDLRKSEPALNLNGTH